MCLPCFESLIYHRLDYLFPIYMVKSVRLFVGFLLCVCFFVFFFKHIMI